MLLLLLTAAAYFYYHWQYFLLLFRIRKMPRYRAGLVLLSFAANYLYFIACSVLEFPLVLNWFFFAFLLFFETLFYGKGDQWGALFHTLTGIIYGLAMNIFCRSVVAILLGQPLQSFDNHTFNNGNLKGTPVLLGFILAGAVLQAMRQPIFLCRFRLILDHRRHQMFLLQMMAGLFFYLFLNLLLYSTPLNDLLLKIWSMKSCVFCIVGFYIAVRYTRRICELDDYREKNLQIELQLKEQKEEEERLRDQTAIDALTGLYNRQYAEEKISSMMEQKIYFTACFLDLDGLKSVNDRYGHEEGDNYILTVTGELRRACRTGSDSLYRYGGDEFLVLFAGMPADAAENRAETVNGRLRSLQAEKSLPYPMSLSYGIVESKAFPDWKDLIQMADQKMYRQKQEKRLARTNEGEVK